MTTSSEGDKAGGRPWWACGTAGALSLAASPTFAVMAWIVAFDAPSVSLCAPAAGLLPIGGMPAMYGLMSLFHLPPWLELASGNRRAPTRSTIQGDRP